MLLCVTLAVQTQNHKASLLCSGRSRKWGGRSQKTEKSGDVLYGRPPSYFVRALRNESVIHVVSIEKLLRFGENVMDSPIYKFCMAFVEWH